MNLSQLKKKKSQTIAGVDDAEKSEPPYTAGGKVKWFSHFGKQLAFPQNDST